jgi:hypothetical protein
MVKGCVIGIVYKVEGGFVYTVEGNTKNDKVEKPNETPPNKRTLTDDEIKGYFRPNCPAY